MLFQGAAHERHDRQRRHLVARRRGNTTYRWIRQLHLWIGAWGALAAIIYGFTGLVMNHRFGDGAWPQGDSEEAGRMTLQIPAAARADAGRAVAVVAADAGAGRAGDPQGLARREGRQAAAEVEPERRHRQRFLVAGIHAGQRDRRGQAQLAHALAAFNRLHKGVGGGWAWTLLADSFAIGMLLLGLSGIWMWARGRTAKQMVVSVLGLSVVVLAWYWYRRCFDASKAGNVANHAVGVARCG